MSLSMKIRPQGLAPRDVRSLEPQLTPRHTAYASPCMFSRLERDVKEFVVYLLGLMIFYFHIMNATMEDFDSNLNV